MSSETARRHANGSIDIDFYRARASRERAAQQAKIGRRGIEAVRLAFAEAVQLANLWSLPGRAPARRSDCASNITPRTIG